MRQDELAQDSTIRLKHVYFYSNRTHFLIKLLRGYYIITVQVFGKPAMIKIECVIFS